MLACVVESVSVRIWCRRLLNGRHRQALRSLRVSLHACVCGALIPWERRRIRMARARRNEWCIMQLMGAAFVGYLCKLVHNGNPRSNGGKMKPGRTPNKWPQTATSEASLGVGLSVDAYSDRPEISSKNHNQNCSNFQVPTTEQVPLFQ